MRTLLILLLLFLSIGFLAWAIHSCEKSLKEYKNPPYYVFRPENKRSVTGGEFGDTKFYGPGAITPDEFSDDTILTEGMPGVAFLGTKQEKNQKKGRGK